MLGRLKITTAQSSG